jgi:hypothetical protein
MAHIRVRYKNGEEDEWLLHERMDLRHFVSFVGRAFARSDGGTAFGIAPEEGTFVADYGMVGVRWGEVVAWTIDGLVDDAALVGPWAEADGIGTSDE